MRYNIRARVSIAVVCGSTQACSLALVNLCHSSVCNAFGTRDTFQHMIGIKSVKATRTAAIQFFFSLGEKQREMNLKKKQENCTKPCACLSDRLQPFITPAAFRFAPPSSPCALEKRNSTANIFVNGFQICQFCINRGSQRNLQAAAYLDSHVKNGIRLLPLTYVLTPERSTNSRQMLSTVNPPDRFPRNATVALQRGTHTRARLRDLRRRPRTSTTGRNNGHSPPPAQAFPRRPRARIF